MNVFEHSVRLVIGKWDLSMTISFDAASYIHTEKLIQRGHIQHVWLETPVPATNQSHKH